MVEINVMGHRFNFQCEDDERKRLQEAANLIEQKMNELPKGSRNERHLIMVSINIAYDLLQLKEEAMHNSSDLKTKVEAIHKILTNAIQEKESDGQNKASSSQN
ncbi:cell division protein ZapA [Thiomicrorhabdus sp. 6S3-12]|uniref:cell division protein ZapA n=1 Tax=Thiomicrorhabdus sp. 6S3-12 TaxID=2819681 RepID=UPI001AACE4EA|nr:cell division protein ZapA [Thiomicrorhabdus sp. 6S3-12]MBO1924265.1 cell division protein ZapA [Thiomicrorhabdus sp. 6S3-12]